jgi:hypothetical protein
MYYIVLYPGFMDILPKPTVPAITAMSQLSAASSTNNFINAKVESDDGGKDDGCKDELDKNVDGNDDGNVAPVTAKSAERPIIDLTDDD